MARLIYRIGLGAGLGKNRARELVSAAYAESGLNPRAQGPAVTHSGYGGRRAAGLFQLLSSGYVNRARELGGVFNPRANTMAILGDYLRYWRQNPNAIAGAGGAAVERSGQGAGFYAAGLPQFQFLTGGQPIPVQTRMPPARQQRQAKQDLALSILNFAPSRRRTGGLLPLLAAQQGYQQATTPTVAPGQNFPNVGGPAEMMLALIREAERRGATVGENPFRGGVDPVHTEGSYHYQRFRDLPRTRFNESRLGRGVDINFASNEQARLQGLFRWLRQTYGLRGVEEALVPGRTWFQGYSAPRPFTYQGHATHGHFAF